MAKYGLFIVKILKQSKGQFVVKKLVYRDNICYKKGLFIVIILVMKRGLLS